eukprot:1104-Prymnesium_polylepis.1
MMTSAAILSVVRPRTLGAVNAQEVEQECGFGWKGSGCAAPEERLRAGPSTGNLTSSGALE